MQPNGKKRVKMNPSTGKTYPYQSSITREASERALAELEKCTLGKPC